MDGCEGLAEGQLIKVKIEELLPDIILVSFKHLSRLFQGALLDSSKSRLPCGIYPPKELFPSKENFVAQDAETTDKLYSVKQRYTYFQNEGEKIVLPKSSNAAKPVKHNKNARMTVRLRPRQVLCSNCQSICNEKSQNISSGKVTKLSLSPKVVNNTNIRKQHSVRETRLTVKENKEPVLVPKLVKLNLKEIETATCVGINSLSSSNQHSIHIEEESLGNEPKQDKRLPLNNSNAMPIRKRKGRGSKRGVSSAVNKRKIIEKEGHIRTRSRGSVGDLSQEKTPEDINISKVTSIIDSTEVPEGPDEERCVVPSPNIDSINDLSNANYEPVSSYVPLPKMSPSPSHKHDFEDSVLEAKVDRINLRIKRSAGLMEDLWEETELDEIKKPKTCDETIQEPSKYPEKEECDNADKPRTTPVLKICFGPEGAKCTEVVESVSKKLKNFNCKSSKKAMKKAKKEAQMVFSSAASGRRLLGKIRLGGKLSYGMGSAASSRIGGFSPGRLGGASPGRFNGASPGRFGSSPGRLCGASSGRFGGASPGRFGGASPGRFGGSSPGKFGGMSPGRFSGVSPVRYAGPSHSILGNVTSNLQRLQPRKHKHKMKHKKRHRDERKYKAVDENVSENISSTGKVEQTELVNDVSGNGRGDALWECPTSPEIPSNCTTNPVSPKLGNMRHKLSISIKRVSDASYVAMDPSVSSSENDKDLLQKDQENGETSSQEIISDSIELPASNEGDLLSSPVPNIVGFENDSDSGDDSKAPNFPLIATEYGFDMNSFMKVKWEDVSELVLPEGRNMTIGDIVWGKMYEYPWWPAKVERLQIFEEPLQSDSQIQRANISWFGTTLKSYVPTSDLQPFSEMIQVKSRAKKGSAFDEAVYQARCEVQRNIQGIPQNTSMRESPITASPREVDVVS